MDDLPPAQTNTPPKANALCERYLTALAEKALPNTVAYTAALYQAQLDYTAKSLSRLDTMLAQLKAKTQPQLAQYQQDKAKTLFFCMLGFYLGEYLAKLTDQPIHWFQGKHYFADQPNLANTFTLTFVCEINGHLIKPLKHIATALFTANHSELSEFIAQSLDTISQPAPLHGSESQLHQQNPLSLQSQSQSSPITNMADVADTTDDDHEQISDVPALSSTANGSLNSQRQQSAWQPDLPQSSDFSASDDFPTHGNFPTNTDFPKSEAASHKKPSQKNASHSKASHEKLSYEEKFNINYNSNILATFKPPMLPNIIATVPLVLLWLYQLYGVYKTYSQGELSITGVVFAVITLAVLVGIWVHYALSFISVFDNKVTVTSPFKNQTTRFDKRVRFFHLQGDGQLLGQKDQVLIKSNTESVSLQAQDHDALTDLLMQVEEELLVPSILARIHNGETVTFSLVKLNDRTIQYGNVQSKLADLGDYDIEGNFLILNKKNGERFARVDINSEPNMNSLLVVLDTLKEKS